MTKKQDLWDKYELWKFGYGIIIGLIIMGLVVIVNINLHSKNYYTIPNGEYDIIKYADYDNGKENFYYLNISHCTTQTGNKCWLYLDEEFTGYGTYMESHFPDYNKKLILIDGKGSP